MRKLLSATLAAALLAGAAGAAAAQTVVVEHRYGTWDPAWGAVPPAPPGTVIYWRNHPDEWYEHVHQCRVRFKDYDPQRDMYMEGTKWVACHY